jgi:hypothetical protein
MSISRQPQPEEVEHLLRNAQLRDELEPFFDESLAHINTGEIPTPVENEFLASMLAWERAPVLPISRWFEPELRLPAPEALPDAALHDALWNAVHQLFEKRIVLDFTDHLSDRELYCLIYRDILPAHEKKIDSGDNYLHWDCADVGDDPHVWLTYYATAAERQSWAEEFAAPLPPALAAPYPRRLPRRPL